MNRILPVSCIFAYLNVSVKYIHSFYNKKISSIEEPILLNKKNTIVPFYSSYITYDKDVNKTANKYSNIIRYNNIN